MAKTIILGRRPTSFAEREVKFADPEGGEDYVVKYKGNYFTATEFGALIDQSFGKTEKAEGEDAPSSEVTIEKLIGAGVGKQAELLMAVVQSWDAGIELNKKLIEQFANELPGGVQAIVADIRAQAVEGKAGNSKK